MRMTFKLIMNLFTISSRSRTAIFFFIFLTSLAVQLAFLSLLPDTMKQNQSTDFVEFYEPVAQNILAGKGIVDNSGNLSTRYSPGYPLILSILFGLAEGIGIIDLKLIVIFNIVVTAISCFLIYLIAGRTFNSRIGLIASLIWLTYPFNLWLIKQPNSEIPFLFFLYFGIWLFVFAINRKYSAFLLFTVGIVFAIAALIRPAGILLGLLCSIAILFLKETKKKNRVFNSLLLVVGFLITMLPWEFHVLSSTGKVIPISTGGPQGIRLGLSYALEFGKGGDRATIPKDVMNVMQRVKAHESELNTTSGIIKYVYQELKYNPVAVLKLYAIKLCRSWYATDAMWYERYILAIQIPYLILGVMGLFLSIHLHRDKLNYVILLITLICYFWGLTVLQLSILRYMIPAMGFVIIFAAISIDTMIFRWQQS